MKLALDFGSDVLAPGHRFTSVTVQFKPATISNLIYVMYIIRRIACRVSSTAPTCLVQTILMQGASNDPAGPAPVHSRDSPGSSSAHNGSQYTQGSYSPSPFEGSQPPLNHLPDRSGPLPGSNVPFSRYPPTEPAGTHPDPSTYYASPVRGHHTPSAGYPAAHPPQHAPHPSQNQLAPFAQSGGPGVPFGYTSQDPYGGTDSLHRATAVTNYGHHPISPSPQPSFPYQPMPSPMNPRAAPLAITGHMPSSATAISGLGPVSASDQANTSHVGGVPEFLTSSLVALPPVGTSASLFNEQAILALWKSVRSQDEVLRGVLTGLNKQNQQLSQLQSKLEELRLSTGEGSGSSVPRSLSLKLGRKTRTVKVPTYSNDYTMAKVRYASSYSC